MTSERWAGVRELFEELIDRAPQDAAALLAARPDIDPGIRAEVLSLLEHHTRAGGFLAPAATDRLTDLFGAAEDLLAKNAESGLAPGTVVGAYTIVREVGRGGMGRVYLATDARLGRIVALKALPPEMIGNATQRERLRREARAAAALAHPGICTVYALEDLDGELYIATEYVDGHTLREEMAAGARRPPQDLRATASELASALASAHAKGIVHRDLKPENIMRDREGRLKILDFGLARIDSPSIPPGSLRTEPGLLIGTPAYMAPEQLNGDVVDARADVFALGVVLYELATGVHPFAAGSPLALIARILDSRAGAIGDRRPDLPAPVARAIDRCLQKAPEDRFPSAVELAAALASPSDVPAPRPSSSATAWWRVHHLIVIALYIAAGTTLWRIKTLFEESARTAPADALAATVTLWLFIVLGVASAIAGIARGHLLFTAAMHPSLLANERLRTAPITLPADLVAGGCLAAAGLLLAPRRSLFGVLTIGLAMAIALARLLMEPSTTAAAFGADKVK